MSVAMDGFLPTLAENISATFGAILLLLCIAFCWKQWKVIRAYRRIPSKQFYILSLLVATLRRVSKDVPFTSVLFQILLKTAKEFREEGLCVVWIPRPYIFIFSEKHIKNLVNNPDLADKGVSLEYNRKIFGNGILASTHESWKVQRKMLNPAFSPAVLKSKMCVLNNHARHLAESLEAQVDRPGDGAENLLKLCACQNMADFVLGLKMNEASKAETLMSYVEVLGEKYIERVCFPCLSWDFMLPFSPTGREYLENVNKVNQLISEYMNELNEKKMESDRKQPNEEDSETFGSIADILMKLHLEDRVLTAEDVRDELVTITSAAYETVYRTLLFCFHTLGHHPRVQEKVYREIRSVVPDGDVTYEDLGKLKYLEAVIKETLRLFSTVPLYERKARKDIQCGQYIIPKGSDVNVLSFIMHRDPNVFPDPEKFDPERFCGNSNLRPWMFIPFFEGYRYCIGKKFAMMEMKVSLVHVLRSVRITSLNEMNDSDLDWGITLKPRKSLLFSFENRLSKS